MTRTLATTALFAALTMMLFAVPKQAAAQFNVLDQISKQVKANSAKGNQSLQNNSKNALGKQVLLGNNNANANKPAKAKPNFQWQFKPQNLNNNFNNNLIKPKKPQFINEGKIDPNKFKPIKPLDLGHLIPGNGNGGGNGNGNGNGNGGNNNNPPANNGNGNNNQQPDWRDIVDAVGDILHGNNGHHGNGNHHGNHGHHNGHPGHNHGPVVVIPSDPVPSYPAAPSVPRNPLPTTSQSAFSRGIVIVNPELNGGNVGFAIGNERFNLESGFQQTLPTSGQRIIRFDRGGDFGLARYSLTDGVYSFKVTSRGWDLVRKTYNIRIDNSANANSFRYVVNGELIVVSAGETNTHKGNFPLVVGFDRGDGGEPAVMRLVRGTFQVRINDATGLWDLADASQPQPISAAPQLNEPALAENTTP